MIRILSRFTLHKPSVSPRLTEKIHARHSFSHSPDDITKPWNSTFGQLWPFTREGTTSSPVNRHCLFKLREVTAQTFWRVCFGNFTPDSFRLFNSLNPDSRT